MITVIREEGQEEQVKIKIWQIKSLVTCVPRHLQEAVAFPLTGRPIVSVEARDTTVHSATSHLAKKLI